MNDKLAEGTPKLEEIARKIAMIQFASWNHVPEKVLTNATNAVKAILRPFIAPVCAPQQTWKCFHCFFETSDYAKAEAHFGEGEGDAAICVYWANLSVEDRLKEFQDLTEQLNGERDESAALLARAEKAEKELALLATPASTGEANGWISRATSATDDLADNPIALEISDSNFPAPTSVPRRSQTDYDPCCAECGMNKSEHDGKDNPAGACANFSSVPQAEPPK